jgi:hypothetical protein
VCLSCVFLQLMSRFRSYSTTPRSDDLAMVFRASVAPFYAGMRNLELSYFFGDHFGPTDAYAWSIFLGLQKSSI